ncbi:Tfp pilus assembly protein FimT/FimU [Geothrix sp. PMB-07]|uniref:pilus assembly FimT family protein n=1 Tax=Geothrix sp. PMB-07 TaxID=3068640 RepID=UPI002740A382|nr:prepilin-type N-terminal cleavage/methylation domain-containing protein [Geothrix sp. PMB-07]WLT32906.1 prepilin-type N-terminal cleavage/methylation domain-containing protein [Geothrix sp. PMB-07]
MKTSLHPESSRGYSLTELLVVFAIVGILAIVGISMLGDRKGNAVRGVMDEIEGVLLSAQRNSVATGTDVNLFATGDWVAGTLTIDGRRTDPADASKRLGSTSELFQSHYTRGQTIHTYAGVATVAGYTTALGGAPGLVTVPPGDSEPFLTALGNNLCPGTDKTVVISGATKRFQTGFCVFVTGLRGGGVVRGGPVGVIVVPGNMANVFKFYKPEGATTWRRL